LEFVPAGGIEAGLSDVALPLLIEDKHQEVVVNIRAVRVRVFGHDDDSLNWDTPDDFAFA
jgi:hypothetical protein